jgi:hypothetical protein
VILPGIFLLSAVLLTFFCFFLPASLWVIDRLFSKVLEQKLLAPAWSFYGMAGAMLCWVLWYLTK